MKDADLFHSMRIKKAVTESPTERFNKAYCNVCNFDAIPKGFV